MATKTNAVLRKDCVPSLRKLDGASVDLVFADPPFNIGYSYDEYQDNQSNQQYLEWAKGWMGEIHRVLKPTGTFWLAIGDEYAAELKLIAQNDLGFSCRSWVVWYYTFGVNCKRKFSRSHAHLFYFVKDRESFTFNDESIRVPSARQLVYGDRRANPKGRLPDDTWVLRPQDLVEGFQRDHDTWYFPRVAGTFKERAGFHGCQMPEQLLGRIIRACSNQDDLVLDPFAGSGTTLVVAKKLGRRWLGYEISKEYAKQANSRVRAAQVGDALEGAPEPLVSAPRTVDGRVLPAARDLAKPNGNKPARARTEQPLLVAERTAPRWSSQPPGWFEQLMEAFAATHQGYSLDRVVTDPELNAGFHAHCRSAGLPGTPRDWNLGLLKTRKSGKSRVKTSRSTTLARQAMDPYLFAAEIALSRLLDQQGGSVDEVLCDADSATQFDRLAAMFAPGYSSFEYRWAALSIRKDAYKRRRAAESLDVGLRKKRLTRSRALSNLDATKLDQQPGIYVVYGDSKPLYVGESFDLKARFDGLSSRPTDSAWQTFCSELSVSTMVLAGESAPRRQGMQSLLIGKLQPELNLEFLAVA